MGELHLVLPTIEHKQAAWAYRQEHIDSGEPWIHGSGGLIKAENYESWLEKVTNRDATAYPDRVPKTTYFAVVDGRIVGTIQIRHTLNDSLLKEGGHIGYGVRPSERRKGYAAKMLTLALQICRELGIEKALVTCSKANIASAKTIIKCGGVFENEITGENGSVVQRYWIALT